MITNEINITVNNLTPKKRFHIISHSDDIGEGRIKNIIEVVLREVLDITVQYVSLFYSEEFAHHLYFETDLVHGTVTWTSHIRKDNTFYFVDDAYFTVAE